MRYYGWNEISKIPWKFFFRFEIEMKTILYLHLVVIDAFFISN